MLMCCAVFILISQNVVAQKKKDKDKEDDIVKRSALERFYDEKGVAKAIPIFGKSMVVYKALKNSNRKDSYQRLLKSNDYAKKLKAAQSYFDQEDFTKAIPLFEELIVIYKGTRNVEKLRYQYAECHYGLKDYTMAAYYFKSFVSYYPKSIYTEDAQYMVAYCNYQLSPKASLDQSNTSTAIEALQLFINTFPSSDRIEECNNLIDELRLKLEQKAFASAELYYKLRNYKAAATAFEQLLKQYSDTPRQEEIMYKILDSYYILAKNSISSKKEERFKLAADSYLDLIDTYPESKRLRDAEKIYSDCLEQLDTIKKGGNTATSK